jgi:ABC-type multidrug transport system ATPase subunit
LPWLRKPPRALIRDNPILILDEPTAALDAESEELVIEALERLMKGRTVITVAHRLSTLRDTDKIVVIKDGIVIEKGPHQELLAPRWCLCRFTPVAVRRALRPASPRLLTPTLPEVSALFGEPRSLRRD